MSLDARRVCEVFAPGPAPSPGEDRRGQFGSGYLLRDGLVLTARHVIEKAQAPCRVRLGGTDGWVDTSEVAWSGSPTIDAAVLRVPLAAGGEASRLGRLAGTERVACRALGFPLAQQRERVRDTEGIEGEIDPLTTIKAGLMAVHIEGSVPLPGADGRSPWAGFSGAALFAGPLLLGVVIVDPASFGTDRLVAVPVAALAADDGFRAVTGAPVSHHLPAVEDEPARELLTAPYEPPPAPGSLAKAPPSRLLNPRNGVVPFHGRRELLDELAGWCAGNGPAVALVFGPGGSGKTRLAAELAVRQVMDGWVGGFLERGADPAALERATVGIIVVVDEAALRIDEIAGLLRRLMARGDLPTRLVLVARDAGDWLRTLADRLADAAGPSRVLEGRWERGLGPLDDAPDGRRATFDEATAAFAAATGRPSDASRPDLASALFERPLFLHLAALTALEGRSPTPGAPIAADLLGATLDLEAGYWHRTSAAQGLEGVDDVVLARAVALATLTTADTEGEAARLLEAVPDLAGDDQLARKLSRWLVTLYPGTGQLRPLEPDLLGEALVGRVLDAVPELASGLLARTDPDQSAYALSMLTRASRTESTAERALRQVLTDDLESLWAAAIEVAQETGDPIGRILAEVLEASPQIPGLAEQLADRIPFETIALREVAMVATRKALEAARTEPAGPERDAEVARLLDAFGIRLAEAGRLEEALDASEEAAATYRELAHARPDEFRAGLARALNHVGNRLAAVGRLEAALVAAEEAAAIFRQIAEVRPGASRTDLATALNNLANKLADLGQLEDALITAEEAVSILRDVASLDDQRAPLAASLNNLTIRLAAVGRRSDALAAAEEAANLFVALAAERPDAFRPYLAAAMYNLADQLAAVGRRLEALSAAEQAVAIRRDLAAARPDAFLPGLAKASNNLAVRLAAVGRRPEALLAAEEAVNIYGDLADERPDAFLPGFGMAMNNLALRLTDVGRREEALKAAELAVDIYDELAAQRPAAFRPDLASFLNNLAIRLADLGRLERALATAELAVSIYREIAAERPDASRTNFAKVLNTLANLLVEVGRQADGEAAAEEALAINRDIAAAQSVVAPRDLGSPPNGLAAGPGDPDVTSAPSTEDLLET